MKGHIPGARMDIASNRARSWTEGQWFRRRDMLYTVSKLFSRTSHAIR